MSIFASTTSLGNLLINPTGMIAYNGYLYVCCNRYPITYSYIIKINLEDPSSYSNWFTFSLTNQSPFGITTDGTYIYVVVNNNNYLVADLNKISKINISNPSGQDTNLDWAILQSYRIEARSIVILNGSIYVVYRYPNKIAKFDYNNPSVKDDNWFTQQTPQVIDSPRGLTTDGTYLYVSSYNSSPFACRISPIDKSYLPVYLPYAIYGSITYINNYIYVSYDNSIGKISTDLSYKNDTWATNNIKFPTGIARDNTYLYSTNTDLVDSTKFNIVRIEINNIPCFNHDTKILTNKGYVPVQDLRKGDLVKTLLNDFKPIHMIGFSEITQTLTTDLIKNQLYKCTKEQYPELFEDLIITGCHSILVDYITDEQSKNINDLLGDIYVTDRKYRLPACLDEKTIIYEELGNHKIYHFALENDNYYMNYGVYANGLLVETCSQRYLKELSNMNMID